MSVRDLRARKHAQIIPAESRALSGLFEADSPWVRLYHSFMTLSYIPLQPSPTLKPHSPLLQTIRSEASTWTNTAKEHHNRTAQDHHDVALRDEGGRGLRLVQVVSEVLLRVRRVVLRGRR